MQEYISESIEPPTNPQFLLRPCQMESPEPKEHQKKEIL
jgi:hypothetical protein